MKFRDIFKRLNNEQKQAASHIDGPLLVIAGPGTGKTQLLSSRVAYILENTDTRAKDILCLTFTNKAAINMQERIIQITDGKAHDVSVRTFHSFAGEIMNMYPDYFWNNARLSTAPDAVQQEIILSILSGLPLNNPLALKFAGRFTVAGDVKNALKLTKEAGLTPDKLRVLLQANMTYIDVIENDLADITAKPLSFKTLDELRNNVHKLPDHNIDEHVAPLKSLSTVLKDSLDHAIKLDEPSGKTKNTGEWKKQWVQTVNGIRGMHKERSKNEWWMHLADVYEQYRRQLHIRGYYDYSDMLVEVLTQIEQHPDLRADIQERYLYVMIDEFQDTNAAQLRLAHLVADHYSADGKPNIMAVGDDDQSIFKFNGAELNNLLTFRDMYPASKTIVLSDNYRSTQEILDLSEKTIAEAEVRLVNRVKKITKKLEAKDAPPLGEIHHYAFRSAEEQFSAVARDIKSKYTADKSIAVIARSHESLRNIAGRLVALNVPLYYEQQQNILEHPLVCQVIYLAEISIYINAGDISSLNSSLSKTLQHPMWNFDPKELWKLAAANYHDPDWLGSLESSKHNRQKLIAEFLLELSQISSNEQLAVTIEYLLGLRETSAMKSPVYDYFANRGEKDMQEYLHGLSAMRYLRSLSAEFHSNEPTTIENFVDYVHLQQSTDEIVTDESPFVSGENAVSLLSVHKAKGLEFDRVYIIDAVEKYWKPRTEGRKPPSNLPLQPTGDEMDDYIRLMFVAITRAKQHLTVSSYRYDAKNNEVLPTPIIASVLPPEEYPEPINGIEILEQALTWPRLDNSDEKLILKNKLESLSLSVTHLINFLDITDCGPQKYLERNLLRLPEIKSTQMAHGTAIHAALEQAQKLVNADKFDIERIKSVYETALKNEHLTAEDAGRYIEHGRELIDKLFRDNFLALEKGSVPEQNITNVVVGKARLGGKLDRIDYKENEFIVSDYKTGNPLHSFETKNTQAEVKAWKQRTQLIFYALLMQNSPRFNTDKATITGQMIYLNAESQKDLSRKYSPSPEEVERMKRLVNAVWEKIRSLDLPDTSIYPSDYSGIQQFEEDLLAEYLD